MAAALYPTMATAIPVLTYDDVRAFVVEKVYPTLQWLAGEMFRRSFLLALNATRALRRPAGGSPPAFELDGATLFSEGGKALELTHLGAEKILETQGGDLDWIDAGSADGDSSVLEIRYKLAGRKFRAVARQDERFPAIDRAAERVPPRILSASLVAVPEDDVHHNITNRLLKYMGPRGTWHETSVRVRDVFPNYDTAFMAARGYSIVVVDTRLRTHTIPFEEDTVLSDLF